MIPRPSFRFAFSHPAHFVSFGFGVGLVGFAPGTFGTLLALPLYWYGLREYATRDAFVILAALFAIGVWTCSVTGRNLGVTDHGAMVWDEIVAFLPLAALCFASLWMQLVAFALFRLFDIWKPFPIRQFEREMKGGFGVMFDDLIAACYAYGVIIVLVLAGTRLLREMA